MTTESAKRRERRRRARAARAKAEAVTAIQGPILAMGDGRTTLTLIRKGERLEVTPTDTEPRKDLFEYWPDTLAVRGLTVLAKSWGWQLCKIERDDNA